MTRLTAEFRAKALIRRVHDAGGSAMVMARGDAMGGGILVLALNRGADPAFWERGLGPAGTAGLVQAGPLEPDAASCDAYWRKRRAHDPDLWVIELDSPLAERFAAEVIAGD